MSEKHNSTELAIFSGECLMGICGQNTGFLDMNGDRLFVGDIVLTFAVSKLNDNGQEYLFHIPDSITSVVSDEWDSYSDGTFKRKIGNPEYFVMGIRSVPIDHSGEWRVKKLKGFEDVVDGEKWLAYGFNYKSIPESIIHNPPKQEEE